MYNNISPFISAYRKNYNTQHVVVRLLEEWRENLDKNYVVGGVLMDLSKAFDCIPNNLLLAKLAAYGVDENLLSYIYSYLLNRKQCVRINNINSDFLNVVSGVPQGSIVGRFYLIVSLVTSFMLLKLLMPTISQTITHYLPSQITSRI